MKKLLFVILGILTWSPLGHAVEELVVYSARKEHLVKPLFEAYEQKTGTKITYVTDKAGALLQKIKAEGENSPADVLITVDAGNLWYAANEGIFTPIFSEELKHNIPDHLRDPSGFWYGLSLRARTIVYSTARVKPEDLSTYQSLGDSEWKGRLCLRTSKKVYNQSLVAMMISQYGFAATEAIVRSWIANLAAPVFSNDTKVMEAIQAGQCDVGIVNSYYFGRLKKKQPEVELALFWPNQDSDGVHVNVSGAGILATSKKKQEATKFLEWMSSADAQNLFSDSNREYPVNPNVKPNPEVAAWGDFKQSEFNLTKAGVLQKEAVKLMDRADYK